MIIEAREDTVTLRGALKANIWPAIQAAAGILLENHPTGIIIDCSALSKITIKGAETFADALSYIKKHNARIVIACLSDEMMEISKEVASVRSQLASANSVEEARASLKLEEITPQRGRAKLAGVVPMLGNWRRAVYQADKLMTGANCEIHLVDLVKVPRSLALGTPLAEREAEGQARLEEAKEEVKETKLKGFAHVGRVRTYAGGIAEYVKELNADFVVMSIDVPDVKGPFIENNEAIGMLDYSNFEISLVKASPSDTKKSIRHAVVPAVGDWKHAIGHACRLISGSEAQVSVIYLITIPRSEPLDVPKPEQEILALDCEHEAARIAKRYGVKISTKVERVRDPIIGFTKLFEPMGFDLAVVGVPKETSEGYTAAKVLADSILQSVPSETIFLSLAQHED